MLPKGHLTSHSKMSGSRWAIIPSWLSGTLRFYLYSSSVYSCHLFLISSASVRWCLLLLLSHFSRVRLCCDPIDGSPPGSPVPGILQARTLEWVAISFFNAWKWKVKVKSLSHVQLFATPWTAAYQASLSMGFSRQEYWSGLPLLSPRWCLGLSNCYKLARKNYSPGKSKKNLNSLTVVRDKSHTRQFCGLLHGRSGSPFYRHHFSNSFSWKYSICHVL